MTTEREVLLMVHPDRDATSLGYVLGVGYKLFPRSLVLVDFQHDMNRIAGQRFRAMLWLTIASSSLPFNAGSLRFNAGR